MARRLDGRRVIVTGGANGIGRAHATFMALQGAKVVVGDLDGDRAADVVAEICALGAMAVSCAGDVTDWNYGKRLVDTAVEIFGGLDVVVNNAGIIREQAIVDMTEEDWDAVMETHLKGTFILTHFAAAYWRDRATADLPVNASIVNTSSRAGLLARTSIASEPPGISNYGSAKSGIATFTEIAAQELGRYGIRVNAIAPSGRTKMTTEHPAMAKAVAAPCDGSFDEWDPANVSPLVGWLSSDTCPVTGRVYWIKGGRIAVLRSWTMVGKLEKAGRWTLEELVNRSEELTKLPSEDPEFADFYGPYS